MPGCSLLRYTLANLADSGCLCSRNIDWQTDRMAIIEDLVNHVPGCLSGTRDTVPRQDGIASTRCCMMGNIFKLICFAPRSIGQFHTAYSQSPALSSQSESLLQVLKQTSLSQLHAWCLQEGDEYSMWSRPFTFGSLKVRVEEEWGLGIGERLIRLDNDPLIVS